MKMDFFNKIIITLAILFTALDSNAQQVNCENLLITDIRFELNQLQIDVSGDSTHLIQVEMINTCENCSGGPDYTELVVFYKGDTIGQVAINGTPRYGEKARWYQALSNQFFDVFPNPESFVVLLNHYCSDIPKEIGKGKGRN